MAKKKDSILADSLPLVAIDLGSDCVRAMAAKCVGEDMFRILGVEQSRKYTCVDRGVVNQTSNAGFMIGEVLRLLANRIGVEQLPTAFVTIGGQTMRIVQVTSHRDQGRKRPVMKKMLDDMERECKTKIEANYKGIAVLGLVPVFYRLDKVEYDQRPTEDDRAEQVDACYIAFYGRKELESNLQKAFDQAGRSIERSFVRPEALVSAFACSDGPEVLQSGCAVLDFGAQTTSLSAFKCTSYLCNNVVPIGSYHITKAIAQQGVTVSVAEQLKCEYGFASPSYVEKNLRLCIPNPQVGDVVFTSASLSKIIEGKLEEMLSPLLPELAKLEGRVQTLYITGGGSMLRGLKDYIQARTNIRVLYGAHNNILDRNTDHEFYKPCYSSLVGTLLLGQEYRMAHKDNPVKAPTIIERIQEKTLEIFADID